MVSRLPETCSRVSASGHMFWERNLRTGPKAPSTKKDKDSSPPGKKEALRRGMRKAGRGGGGGGGGGTELPPDPEGD